MLESTESVDRDYCRCGLVTEIAVDGMSVGKCSTRCPGRWSRLCKAFRVPGHHVHHPARTSGMTKTATPTCRQCSISLHLTCAVPSTHSKIRSRGCAWLGGPRPRHQSRATGLLPGDLHVMDNAAGHNRHRYSADDRSSKKGFAFGSQYRLKIRNLTC